MDRDEEKDEHAVEAEARMKAALEWESTARCRITDLKEPLYDDASRLIKRHYLSEEPMCKASALLRDKTSATEYLELIKTRMKDTTSLVATSIASGRVIGVAVARINSVADKTDTYDRVQILKGKSIRKIEQLRNTLIAQTRAHERFGHDRYLSIYVLCVHPSYREKGVAVALLNASVQAAIALGVPAIGGIFSSGASQATARSAGFQLLHEIRYSLWIIDDRVVFDDPGRGNYSAALMGKSLPVERDDFTEDDLSSAGTVPGK